MKNNVLVVDDTSYEMNSAYLCGARAMRQQIPFSTNPHRYGTQAHDDWNYGHENESTGLHTLDDEDLISLPRNGSHLKVALDSAADGSYSQKNRP